VGPGLRPARSRGCEVSPGHRLAKHYKRGLSGHFVLRSRAYMRGIQGGIAPCSASILTMAAGAVALHERRPCRHCTRRFLPSRRPGRAGAAQGRAENMPRVQVKRRALKYKRGWPDLMLRGEFFAALPDERHRSVRRPFHDLLPSLDPRSSSVQRGRLRAPGGLNATTLELCRQGRPRPPTPSLSSTSCAGGACAGRKLRPSRLPPLPPGR